MEAENVQNVQTLQNPPALLMLDSPRVLALRDGKLNYTFHFRRITQADWLTYFNGMYVASRNDGAAQLNTTDLQTAGIELFESTVTKVIGYSRELNTPADFKKVLPRHSIPASWLLRTVLVSTVDEDKPLDCDSVEARIDAVWSQTTPGDETTMYRGLVHRFTPPTLEQKKKFMRGGAINRVIGGGRKGSTTIYSLKNHALLNLYDQLIQSVDGYGVAGEPLKSVEDVRREMDGYHKVEAVSQLFNTMEAQPETATAEAA
jgi:hypothetical protein